MGKSKHPNQPIIIAEDGCIRFKKNSIVDAMLDLCTKNKMSLNEISIGVQEGQYSNEDYVQLMQLIGYSTSGYGDLNCVSSSECRRADSEAYKLYKKNKR